MSQSVDAQTHLGLDYAGHASASSLSNSNDIIFSDAKLEDVEKVTSFYASTESSPDPSLQQLPSVPPSIRYPRYAQIRYAIFTVYRRLFSVVFAANLIAFILVISKDRSSINFINAAAVNLLCGGLARNPWVVNLLFLCLCSVPKSASLRLRLLAAKAFHYGGVHSGCGVAAVVWYIGYIGLLSHEATNTAPLISPALITLAVLILILLLAIITAAYPLFRIRRHDYFEFTHRFAGWLVIGLFWSLLFVFAEKNRKAHSLGPFLVRQPTFWIMIILTIATFSPWLCLRKVDVVPEYISPHVIRLHFDYTTIRLGQVFSISKHPLRDWHGFALFPDLPLDGKSFSCLVSKAGDWSSDCIAHPPTRLWKRGVPTFALGYCMRVFRSFILVATGSGIAYCLSFLAHNRPPARLIWQTKSPLKTYGQGVLDCVARLHPNPTIIDTSLTGRKDMVPIILDEVRSSGAEAVLVISNAFFTKKIVFELEARNVPAYGPIFDS